MTGTPYRNILLIEDDQDDVEIFLLALQEIRGNAVCTSESNAAIALQKLKDQQLAPDVIFLDLNMPIMNGLQFLTELKKYEALRAIPVIILSTSSQPSAKLTAKALGAEDFITKPHDYVSLKQILQSFVG